MEFPTCRSCFTHINCVIQSQSIFSFFGYVKVTHCILAVLSAICVPSVYIEHRNILIKKKKIIIYYISMLWPIVGS